MDTHNINWAEYAHHRLLLAVDQATCFLWASEFEAMTRERALLHIQHFFEGQRYTVWLGPKFKGQVCSGDARLGNWHSVFGSLPFLWQKDGWGGCPKAQNYHQEVQNGQARWVYADWIQKKLSDHDEQWLSHTSSPILSLREQLSSSFVIISISIIRAQSLL